MILLHFRVSNVAEQQVNGLQDAGKATLVAYEFRKTGKRPVHVNQDDRVDDKQICQLRLQLTSKQARKSPHFNAGRGRTGDADKLHELNVVLNLG